MSYRQKGIGDYAPGTRAEETTNSKVVFGGSLLLFLLFFKRCFGLALDVRLDLVQPERERVDLVFKQLRRALHELGEARSLLDQMRVNQIVNPLVLLHAFDFDL